MGDRCFAVGIDVGGTVIKAAIISSKGDNLATVNIPCSYNWKFDETGPKQLSVLINKAIEGILLKIEAESCNLLGIGVAVANTISPEGIMQNLYPGPQSWNFYNMGADLRSLRREEIRFTVDAHAAALGEARFGAGTGFNMFNCVTVGTGVGCGTIIDGKIFRGGLGAAGNLGHTVVISSGGKRCCCGCPGCLETVCSSAAIVEKYHRISESGNFLTLKSKVPIDPEETRLTPGEIYHRALQGDTAARRTFEEVGLLPGDCIFESGYPFFARGRDNMRGCSAGRRSFP